MAAASGDGNGPAACADLLFVGGATYALTGRTTSRHQRRVACCRRRRGDRALPPSPSWAASCRRSIQRASASTPVSPGCWLCILPSVRCLPSGWTIGLRRRPPPQAATLDRQLRPPYLRRWLRHGSTMQRPRGRALLRGMSLAQTPPGLPLARRLPGGFACRGQQAGIYLARQGPRRGAPLPPRARRAWSTFGTHAIGTQRVASGTSFAQVIHAILREPDRVQNPDKTPMAGGRHEG